MSNTVDFDRIFEKQKELDAKRNSGENLGVRFYKIRQGDNRGRLMPKCTANPNSAAPFVKESAMHFSVGPNQAAFMCLGAGCPICQYALQLNNSSDPSDLESASQICAKTRYYSSWIDLDEPVYTAKDLQEWKANSKDVSKDPPFVLGDSKIQILSYGPDILGKIYKQFTSLRMDISNLDTGYDLILNKTGKGKEGTKYTLMLHPIQKAQTIIKKGMVLSGDAAVDALPDLDLVLTPRKAEDMIKALNGSVVGNTGNVLPASVPAPALPPVSAPAPVPVLPSPKTAVVPPISAVSKSVEDDNPPCYKDVSVWSETDPECVGGCVGDEEFDKCPLWQQCGEAVGKLKPVQAVRRGRRPSPKAVVKAESEADLLEEELASAIK